jgi:hypothetical protein
MQPEFFTMEDSTMHGRAFGSLEFFSALLWPIFFCGLLFCFFKSRLLAAIFIALLAGYWLLDDFRSDSRHSNDEAQPGQHSPPMQADRQSVALFEQDGNPSTVKNSPVWAAAEKYVLFDYQSGLGEICSRTQSLGSLRLFNTCRAEVY